MKRLVILAYIATLATSPSLRAQTSTVTWTATHQTIDGFGAFDINMRGAFNTSSTILNQLFTNSGSGPNGANVGLSILRVPIADDSGSFSNTGTDPGGDCSTVNTGCAGITTEEAFAAGQGVRIYATPWSPPPSMKSNGSIDCHSGGGNGSLLASSYDGYATWLSNYITSVTNAGINVYAITPQNEPNACTSGYGGALWNAADFDNFIKTNLGPTMAAAGQLSQTQIAMPETGGHGNLDTYASASINDASASQYISICSDHEYGLASYPNHPGPDSLCGNAGKHLWMSEIYCCSTYDGSITDGLTWGEDIHNWLANANANAWLWWQIFSPYNDNEPLYQPGTTNPSKRLFVIGQWSKFVRPGWIRIDATASPTNEVYISAFKEIASGNFAIVAINQNSGPVNVDFSLAGFPSVTSVTPTLTSASYSLEDQASVSISGATFSYSLPGTSVTTFHGTASSSTTATSKGPASPTNLAATVK